MYCIYASVDDRYSYILVPNLEFSAVKETKCDNTPNRVARWPHTTHAYTKHCKQHSVRTSSVISEGGGVDGGSPRCRGANTKIVFRHHARMKRRAHCLCRSTRTLTTSPKHHPDPTPLHPTNTHTHTFTFFARKG